MKTLNNLDKKYIDQIICTRYIQGYSEYDPQYKSLLTKIVRHLCVMKNPSDGYDKIPTLVG
jgi:hypothetical protein